MGKFEKKYQIGIIVCGLLTLLGIVAIIGSFSVAQSDEAYICLAMMLFILYYTVSGYKVPHGDMLKYLMWAFAIILLRKASIELNYNEITGTVMVGLSALMTAYISGRLNRINQNKYFCAVIGGCLLYDIVSIIISTSGAAQERRSLQEHICAYTLLSGSIFALHTCCVITCTKKPALQRRKNSANMICNTLVNA